jgi:hypothetical protein
MGARAKRIYLFYQFSVGKALDRDSESSPRSGSIYEIPLPITREKQPQTSADDLLKVGLQHWDY